MSKWYDQHMPSHSEHYVSKHCEKHVQASSTLFVFCRPAHALYFATYELAKQGLGGNEAGHHPVATAVAGSIATIVNDGIMTPSDVVKQRLQVANSPYKGMMDCILRVSREEGLAAFFKSYRTTVSLWCKAVSYMLQPHQASVIGLPLLTWLSGSTSIAWVWISWLPEQL